MTLDRLRPLFPAVALLVLASPAFAHMSMDLGTSVQMPPFLRAGTTERIEAIATVGAFDPAAGVTFTIEASAGSFVSASAGNEWNCSRETRRVRCTANEAAAGPHVVLLDITTPATGTLGLTASISSIASGDPVETNNSMHAEARVYSAAACTATAPAALHGTFANGAAALEWSAVEGAESYEVFASVDGEEPHRIATTNATRTTSRFLGGDITWSVRATFANCPPVASETHSFPGGTPPALRVTSIRSPLFTEPVSVAVTDTHVLIADAAQRGLRTYDRATGVVAARSVINAEPGAPPLVVDGGIAVGPGNFAYIADRSNHLVRYAYPILWQLFTANGTPNTPGSTDGAGKAARFREPLGIVANERAQVFVADSGNDTIRKTSYDATKGEFVTTTFVSASAGLDAPAGLAFDADGNLLVADRGHHVIRRISPTGTVTTLAGVFGEPGHRDGDAAQALFRDPIGIAVDSRGNVFVSEEGNHTIRRIAPNGRVTTVAGTPGESGDADGLGAAARFERPGMLAIDEDGVLWIADRGNAALRRAEISAPAAKRRAARP